jgi:hypothetical protein
MILYRKHHPQARFASWAFACLLVLFVAIATVKPSVGLAGLGSVLILSALLVEANKTQIWENYKKNYKYRKSDPLPESWTKPRTSMYFLNVYVVWPAVFVIGFVAIYAAYLIA